MRDALASSGKAAVGELALRGSERLALVHAYGDVMVLQMLRWPDEPRSSADAAPSRPVELSDEEINGALALIESMSGVRIEDYHDEYAETVEAVIHAKVEGAEPPPSPAPASEKTGTADLMTALEASVNKARTGASAGGDADVTHIHERKPRKTTAKKATAKETAAKNTTTAGRKSTGRGKRTG